MRYRLGSHERGEISLELLNSRGEFIAGTGPILISRSDSQIEVPVAAEIADPSVIKIKLNGNLAEKQPDPGMKFFMRLFGERTDLYAPNFSRAMEYAAKDARIKAVYVDIQRIGGSMAQLAPQAFETGLLSTVPVALSISVSTLLLAMALPQPKVWKVASAIRSPSPTLR